MKNRDLIFIAVGLGVLYFLSRNQAIPAGYTAGAAVTPQLQSVLTTTLQNDASAAASIPLVAPPISKTLIMESIA